MSTHSHDPALIDEAATTVNATATAAVTSAAVAALGIGRRANSWGADQCGGAFAAVYLAPAERALSAVLAAPYHLSQVAETLSSTAAQYRRVEAENTVRSGDIG